MYSISVALLLPTEEMESVCRKKLPYLGRQTLSYDKTETKAKVRKCPSNGLSKKRYGCRKPVSVKLSTGECKVQAKVDCWVTFKEYLELTE